MAGRSPLGSPSASSPRFLQRRLHRAAACHALHVAVVDLVAQGGHDALLAAEEVGAGQIRAADGVGCVVDWLNGEIDATPEQLARQVFACMPTTLRKAYEQSS